MQSISIERLGQEAVHARYAAFSQLFREILRCHGHDRHLPTWTFKSPNPSRCLKAVYPWHANVHQDQVKFFVFDGFNGLDRRFDADTAKTSTLQHCASYLTVHGDIIDDEHANMLILVGCGMGHLDILQYTVKIERRLRKT
jgi:hypothetical protein